MTTHDDLLRGAIEHLTDDEREQLERMVVATQPLWVPDPKNEPQQAAYDSEAMILGFGGSAGGGKSDLGCGLATTRHRKVGFFRKTGTELTAILDRFTEILGTRDGYNGKDNIWRFRRPDGVPVQVEFCSFPNPGDEQKYQGRPHDLLVFDEAAEMREDAVRFVQAWKRSARKPGSMEPEQRERVVLCFNPPMRADGRWIIPYFAPWLDPAHPNPAEPGELRWCITVDSRDVWVDGPDDVRTINGKEYTPHSRTFIPSRVSDNSYLAGTGYETWLQGLKEPWRSRLLEGDFRAGMEDDDFQVIPTKWVEAAQERWERPDVLPEMDSMGVDVALGGRDNTIIARRHGMWFDEPIIHPGSECTSGTVMAGFVTAALRDRAPIHVDVFGVGAQLYGPLCALGLQAHGVNVGDPAPGTTKGGGMQFSNLRTQLWWRMREALDPDANTGIALPPSRALLADLCAPVFELRGRLIHVEGRDKIVKRLGRSPDFGSAYCLALMDTMKTAQAVELLRGPGQEYDPFRNI